MQLPPGRPRGRPKGQTTGQTGARGRLQRQATGAGNSGILQGQTQNPGQATGAGYSGRLQGQTQNPGEESSGRLQGQATGADYRADYRADYWGRPQTEAITAFTCCRIPRVETAVWTAEAVLRKTSTAPKGSSGRGTREANGSPSEEETRCFLKK